MIMSEQTKPGESVEAPATSATEQVPRLARFAQKRMFTDVMDEPMPDEFKALLGEAARTRSMALEHADNRVPARALPSA